MLLTVTLTGYTASVIESGAVFDLHVQGLQRFFIGVYRNHNIIMGTCVTIRQQMFKRKNEVTLADDDNKEFALYLPGKYKLQDGTVYILYFKNHNIGEQLDINLLGFKKRALTSVRQLSMSY